MHHLDCRLVEVNWVPFRFKPLKMAVILNIKVHVAVKSPKLTLKKVICQINADSFLLPTLNKSYIYTDEITCHQTREVVFGTIQPATSEKEI